MNITKRIIQRNYTAGRRNNKIGGIVMHTYGGKGTSLYNWFNKEGTGASAHYAVLKSGEVEQYVEDKDTSWAASNFDVNLRTINIEHQDDGNSADILRTDALYKSSAQLVANLCKKHGIPCKLLSKEIAVANKGSGGISLHRYYANKPCPGGLNIERIIYDANNILNNNEMIKLNEKLINYIRELRPDVVDAKVDIETWYTENGAREFIDENYNRKKDIERLENELTTIKNNQDIDVQKLTELTEKVKGIENELNLARRSVESQIQALELKEIEIKELKTKYEEKLSQKNKEIEEIKKDETIGDKINNWFKSILEKLRNKS